MHRLLCYAHFDESGTVRPFVMHSLSSMAHLCSTMIFVSNSPLTDGDLRKLRTICADVVVNDNTGYDFYMWKLALRAVDYKQFDEVVLMNSSVFGPLFPMDGIFAEMERYGCDFWGITECFQVLPHYQSYFLVFREKVLSSPRFQLFWDNILPYAGKKQVIQSYEVGLSQWLVESGFLPAAYCDFEKIGRYCRSVGRRLRRKDNVSITHAAELLQIGNPFLKRDAVRRGIAGREAIRRVPAAGSFPLDFIDEPVLEKRGSVCPLCGSPGKVAHKGVRDFLDLHNAERYDYYRCGSMACAILWQISPRADDGIGIFCGPLPTTLNDPGVEITDKPGWQSRNSWLALHRQGKSAFPWPPDLQACQGKHGLKREGVPGKILVLGYGNADLLSKLHRFGWDVTRFETDLGTLAKSRRQTGNIHHGLLDITGLESEQFDLILIINALERSTAPHRVLEEAYRLLKPNGFLQLVTPNVSAASRFLFRRYWFGLNAPRHRIIHSRGSLRRLLSSVGFRSIKIKSSTRNAEEYAMHSLDDLINRWTSLNVAHRIGREILPQVLRFTFAAVNMITRRHGEECYVYTEKTLMSAGEIPK